MRSTTTTIWLVIATAILTIVENTFEQNIESKHDEETNPFVEAAKSFLDEALANVDNNDNNNNNNKGNSAAGGGLAVLGGFLQQFLQKDGAKQLGDVFARGNVGNNGADILSGIAKMFTDNGSDGGSQGLDPSLIGHVAEFITNAITTEVPKTGDDYTDARINEIPTGGDSKSKQSSSSTSGQHQFDWNSALQLASMFMANSKTNQNEDGEDNNNNNNNNHLETLLNLLPLLSNGLSSASHVHFADSELEDKEEHDMFRKPSFLPPFLNNLYEYWEHFKSSELGQTLWSNSGLENIFKLFVDAEGYFQVDRIFESMENNSFRRKWIKSLSSYVGGWIKHLSDPITQARYLSRVQFVGNGFLKAQGYSKTAFFDASRPAESLSFLIDAVFKRQFGLKVNSYTYIKPAIAYIQDVFRLGQSKGLSLSHLSSQEIGNKLTEVINGDVIEPLLRVWRAYKYSVKNPLCDRHVICSLNTKDNQQQQTKTGLKPAVTKLFSLVAAWYLPNRTGTPFWKLYNAITEEHNCQTKYPVDCKEFFDEDLRVTTEYTHSEL